MHWDNFYRDKSQTLKFQIPGKFNLQNPKFISNLQRWNISMNPSLRRNDVRPWKQMKGWTEKQILAFARMTAAESREGQGGWKVHALFSPPVSLKCHCHPGVSRDLSELRDCRLHDFRLSISNTERRNSTADNPQPQLGRWNDLVCDNFQNTGNG